MALLIATAISVQLFAFANSVEQSEAQTRRVGVPYDVQQIRGVVLFDHKIHQASINPDSQDPHRAPAGVACGGCHHTVKDVAQIQQFQPCHSCHKAEGDPKNPEDKEGIELSSREALHRSCIGCHRASNLKTSNPYFTNVSFTKCGECHIREQRLPSAEEQPELQPLPEPELPVPAKAQPSAGSVKTPVDPPLGFAGPSPIRRPEQVSPDYAPIPDRWRIGFPEDPRFEKGSVKNPYRQNVLKGDYPIWGQHYFLNVTAESESVLSGRRLPVPSDVSTQRPDSAEFFGRGGQFFYRQNFSFLIDLSHGDAGFKPTDWRIQVVPNFNINYLHTQENGIVNIDPRRGNTRLDGYISLQSSFTEVRLGDSPKLFPFLRGRGNRGGESPYFDTTSIRAGIQPFISDFRGFIFSDVNLGVRLFGNYGSNRYQFNAAYFNMLEKDTNSELNTFKFRDQNVFILNLFRQDTKWTGYTTQLSLHYSNDKPSRHFDVNRFLVRPALVGDVAPHGIKVAYLGWAGDGHMGRLNISHAFYEVLGADTRNPISGRRLDVNAQMAALELSVDRDWLRYKGSAFWASGDRNPLDSKGRGFDAILDFPEFAGGKFSFWNSQGIRLTQTGVGLVNPDSLLPSLRSSRIEGQANFVNPGVFLYNLALDADLTPKLKAVLNLNYLHFHHTEPLELLLFQPGIRKGIGFDYGIGVSYRPLLNENIILVAGYSSLIPGPGLRDIYSSNCTVSGCGASAKHLHSLFVRLRFTY